MIKETVTLNPGLYLSGKIDIISSKSELHRLIICACLSDSKCVIGYNSLLSKDIIATISCFRNLGADIDILDNEIVINKPLPEKIPKTELFCNESGSTARFILPIVSLLAQSGTTITGAGKLPDRPFDDLCECLEKHGAKFSSHSLPITIVKNLSPNKTFEISGNISSQYLTGLLLMLPKCEDLRISLTTELNSSGYVDITISAMEKFGVQVEKFNNTYKTIGNYKTLNEKLCAYGDWSNAAFFMCGAKEKEITISGIDVNSYQPDKKILDILKMTGVNVKVNGTDITLSRNNKLIPFDIDAEDTPDIVPILAVLASSIEGKSVIRNIRRLKFKESNRIESVRKTISSLGGNISSDENNIYIDGKGYLIGGTVDSYNDHRIAMSGAIASLFCKEKVIIKNASSVEKSYPTFFEEFLKLTDAEI